MIDEILKNLKEKHGVDIERSNEIDALIRYVSHVSYNAGWTEGFAYGKKTYGKKPLMGKKAYRENR